MGSGQAEHSLFCFHQGATAGTTHVAKPSAIAAAVQLGLRTLVQPLLGDSFDNTLALVKFLHSLISYAEW